jgi:hypothetical protein
MKHYMSFMWDEEASEKDQLRRRSILFRRHLP